MSYIFNKHDAVPYVRLQGKWLDEIGFEIGSAFQLEIIDSSIILKKIKNTDEKQY